MRPARGRGMPRRVGTHGRPQRPAMGQGRLRPGRARKVRLIGPRDALGPARHRRPHKGFLRPGNRPGRIASGPCGLRNALQGRFRRGFPGREQGTDGDTAPPAATDFLRPRNRSRTNPPRPHPGPLRPPLLAPAQWDREGDVPSPFAGEKPQKDPRGAAVPGTADANGHRRRRFQRGRSRPVAPGHGFKA